MAECGRSSSRRDLGRAHDRASVLAAIQIGGARLGERLGIDAGRFVSLKAVTSKLTLSSVQESFDNLDAFDKTIEPLAFTEGECVEFLLAIAQTERGKGFAVFKTSGCQLHRHVNGWRSPKQHHRRADRAMFRLSAQPRQRRHLIEPVQAGNIVMIAHRERVEAHRVRYPHLLDQRGQQRRAGFVDGNLRIELHAEFICFSLRVIPIVIRARHMPAMLRRLWAPYFPARHRAA